MPSYVTPKKNTAFVCYVFLEDQANAGLFKANPTLAEGDVKIAVDDAAPANLTTLPAVDADFTKRVKVSLSAAEMNGDNVSVLFSDAAGAEWYDLGINIQTTAKQIDDIPSANDIWNHTNPLTGQTEAFQVSLAQDIASSIPPGLVEMITGGGDDPYQFTEDALALAPGASALDADALRAALGMAEPDLDDQLDAIAALGASCASVVANSTDATASGAITRKRGNTWSIALTLGEITSYTSLWFSIKRSYDDADSASVLQVKLNSPSAADGLLYVNGAAATNAALGSITVSNAGTGAIVIAVDETITDDIAPGSYYYDAQVLITGAVTTPDSGTFTVTADVTRSVA